MARHWHHGTAKKYRRAPHNIQDELRALWVIAVNNSGDDDARKATVHYRAIARWMQGEDKYEKDQAEQP